MIDNRTKPEVAPSKAAEQDHGAAAGDGPPPPADDLERYIRDRAARDPVFARRFETGYLAFRRRVLRLRARAD
jgi:hypothetical protein